MVVFNCKISHIPFVFLGLPIGGDRNRLNFWQPLVDRNKKKIVRMEKYRFVLRFSFHSS